ncbi:hypothetical protein [Oryza sativa Japonica Group]|uniref:Uncharacterized protein n=1 Tax=Oryza sativa subsp. japonica TaxID=39947 RepID=Q5Z8B9_ORYSJ|nr:hypothetical protein [Oryza sativa Japonica Group]
MVTVVCAANGDDVRVADRRSGVAAGAQRGVAMLKNKVDLHRQDQQPTERCINC